MATTRRTFLQVSATAASALALRPIGFGETAVDANGLALNPTVKAVEDKMLRAGPVPMQHVRVTGGPLKNAQDLTAKYLLSLDPDRMMAFYRVRAGLPQKALPYTGWDGGGRNLTGHIAGHHLSAVSLMFLATGDTRFKDRATYLVNELKIVQDKQGDGYLGALEGTLDRQPISGRDAFAMLPKGDIRSGGFDLNGMWSPWYVLHKTFAGLRDAYRHTGNATALQVEINFAAWADTLLKPLTDTQFQKMLNTEHGGMNEVLADLYADTGDKRWLDLSYKFEHRAFTDQLKRHQDNLSGKHGNCQIPKLCGSAARFGYTGDTSDIIAASFFWDRVAQHHSYATGGHGLDEYFGPPDILSTRVNGRTCESCNVYNMLKLTRRLFSLRPDPLYADFHERALFNHVLGSIDDQDGRTSYMVPVGRGVQQEYQNMDRDFTCCVGSGMESHALHGDGLYYESTGTAGASSGEALWVNLFVPSTVAFTNGVNLKMDTGFPDGDMATMTLAMAAPKTFALMVRRPIWAGDAFAIKVNGTIVAQPPLASLRGGAAAGRSNMPGNEGEQTPASSYVELKQTWKSGDTIELTLPKSVRLESTPDNKSVAAIMWGPLVLAGDMGPRRDGRGAAASAPPIPVLVAADRPVADWVLPVATRAGDFTATRVAHVPATPTTIGDVSLTPFYRTHRKSYSIYFDVLTPAEFESRASAIAAENERLRKLEAATVAFVQPGEMQPERNFNYQSDPPDRPVVRTNGRANRGGAGWFSFDLAVDPSTDMAVIVTYLNDANVSAPPANFDIVVDGTSIAHFAPNASATGFYDARYAVPGILVTGKTKVTVRFQAATPGRIAPVFGVRMVRAGAVKGER